MKFTLISNIFAPHVRGGYELGCETIARRLIQAGHEVTVVTSQSAGALDKTPEPVGLKVRRIFEPVFEYEEPVYRGLGRSHAWQQRAHNAFGGVLPGNVVALHNYFEENPADVVWLFNPLGIGPVGIAEVVANQPAKCLIHFMDHIDDTISSHQHFQNYGGRWQRIKRRLTAISCSDKIRNSNEKIGGYRQHHVVYNGFNPAEIPTNLPDTRNGKFRFLYFGQFTREKGLVQVVKGFASLVKSQPKFNCELDLVGRGSSLFENELAEVINTEGVAAKVNKLGFLPKQELLGRLGGYDAAVMLLNSAEPFAYAPLEAACAGLPVLITSETGNAEVFPQAYPLMVANRDDVTGVRKKLEWCLNNRGNLRPLAQKLWSHLSSHCDFESVTMPAYLKAIEQCPVNQGVRDLRPLLAAYATTNFYSQFH